MRLTSDTHNIVSIETLTRDKCIGTWYKFTVQYRILTERVEIHFTIKNIADVARETST